MTPGPRTHKQASVTIAAPMGLPAEYHDDFRELTALHSGNPRKGDATALMYQVCAEADRNSKALLLLVEAYDDGSMTGDMLRKWYSRFGFKVAQESPCLMLRAPERPTIIGHA